jgi:hypothetical protein
MATGDSPHKPRAGEGPKHEVKIGVPECPRCKKTFTASYWRGDQLIQARCLSCDLKWPRPDVV